MALPVAHFAAISGWSRSQERRVLAVLCILSVLPDFDFAFVWGFGFPLASAHRTWSHSLAFALVFTLAWALLGKRLREINRVPSALVLVALSSHILIDLLCTLDAQDHGLMLLWPFSDARFGWPVLVPLYLLFDDSPFDLQGLVSFTFLECLLAFPIWLCFRSARRVIDSLVAKPAE